MTRKQGHEGWAKPVDVLAVEEGKREDSNRTRRAEMSFGC